MWRIGFGTGSLYKIYEWSMGYEERIRMFSELWCAALELNLPTQKLLQEFTEHIQQNPSLQHIIKTFEYISIHAPRDEPYQDNDHTKTTLAYLRTLHEIVGSDGIVIHAEDIKDPILLSSTQLTRLVENMQKRKNPSLTGTNTDFFTHMNDTTPFRYTLDLEHAYEFNEEDPSRHRRLAEVMWDRLQELHVSGYNHNEHHAPVSLSNNKDTISQQLEQYKEKDVVIILEGVLNDEYKTKSRQEIKDMIKTEYDHIKTLLT